MSDVSVAEARYQTMVDTLSEGVLVYGLDGRIKVCNPAASRILGLSREQLRGAGQSAAGWSAVDEDMRPLDIADLPVSRTFANGASEHGVVIGLGRPDGGLIWLSINTEPIRDEKDGGICAVIVTLEDITRGKQTDAAIREAERRWILALESAGHGVWDWDVLSGKVYFSHLWKSMLGYADDEIGNALSDWRDRVHPDDLPGCLADLDRHFRGESRHYRNEHRVLCKDGEYKWILAQGQVESWRENGKPLRVIGTHTDIGERKLAEATMTALRGEMQALLEWQVAGQTAASIAHELNQPLNAITTFGAAALMRMEAMSPPQEKLVKAVEGMVDQADRAGRMLRELMSFFRKSELPVEAIDLNVLMDEAVALTRASGFGHFKITVVHAPGLRPVLANRLRIEKVCLNLLRNGMEAMAESGAEVWSSAIGIHLVDTGDHVMVSIRDQGPGLDTETARRIFEPFFSTKSGGIGMGLTISRSLIEAHGGKLWCDPEPDPASGKGATFHFTLPFAS